MRGLNMDNLRSIAISWVLKCFNDMGGKNLTDEQRRLMHDDKYLSDWLLATNFKKIPLPTSLYFTAPESTVIVEVEDYEVEISISKWLKRNDGIGAYEYWGSRGFDAGNDYAEVEEITCDAKDPYVKWYIENYLFDEIQVESISNYDEPEYERDDDYA